VTRRVAHNVAPPGHDRSEWGKHPDAVSGLVLLADWYQPTKRTNVPLVAPSAIPLIGDMLRYTVSPLLKAALLPLNLRAMFAPLPVPERSGGNFRPASRFSRGRSERSLRTLSPRDRLWSECQNGFAT
jgi:hypothetical protein